MAKNSGNTRVSANSAGGSSNSSRYARATVFGSDTPYNEGMNYIQRMRQDLNQFADRENAAYSEEQGAMFSLDGQNISRFSVQVAQRPLSFSELAVSYKISDISYLLPTYGTPDYQAFQQALKEIESKEFNSIEDAYNEVKRINAMVVRKEGAEVQGDTPIMPTRRNRY